MMTEGICPTNGCHNDEPAIVHCHDDLWCVSCKKCGGYMTYFTSPDDEAYMHGIDLWMAVTKEMSKYDKSRGRSEDE